MNNFSILNLTNKLFIVQKVGLLKDKLKVQSYSLDLRPVFDSPPTCFLVEATVCTIDKIVKDCMSRE